MIKKFFKPDQEKFLIEIFKKNIDAEKIQKLIDRGVDFEKKNEKGQTLLYSLVARRKVEVIKIFIKNKANLYSEDNYKKTILDEAVAKGDGMMIRFLLENGMSVNKKNSENRTPLQNVVLLGDNKAFQIFTRYKPDYNLKNGYEKSILFDAVEGGNVQILKTIVNNVENLNPLDSYNKTPLFYAVLKEDSRLSSILIDNGADVNILDNEGENALYNAVILGDNNLEIIKKMILKGISTNILNHNGKNILDQILDIVEMQNASRELLEGKFALVKENFNYRNIVKFLVSRGLDLNKFQEDGKNTLLKVINDKKFADTEFLISCGANINAICPNGKTILYNEVVKGYSNYKMIDFIIDHGASIEQIDSRGLNILNYLNEILLVKNSFKEAEIIDENDLNYDEDYVKVLKKILAYRPDYDAKRLDGTTILFDIINYNNFFLSKLYIDRGANVNAQDDQGNTVLSYLVEQGIKIKTKTEKKKFLERLVFLLRYRVNVDIQDINKRTVIHKAVMANDLEILEKLLTKKANLELKDKFGRTPLHYLQVNGNYKMARWLIAAGADINAPDNSGFTLLNYAALFGHVNLIVVLVKAGVLMYNRNSKNKRIARFFKDKEFSLDKLLEKDFENQDVKSILVEVVENLKKEINEVLGE